MSKIESFDDLIVYQKAYRLAMEIFEISKSSPREEKYSLTDQIRRSSRSVAVCISEAWSRRRYEKAFVSKLIDSLGEEFETETWINFSYDCSYIDCEKKETLQAGYMEVRKIIISIINNPEKWCP